MKMSQKRTDMENQSSTSTNLKPDPEHGGLVRFGDVLVTRRFCKDMQPLEQKLQDPATKAVARLQSAAGVRCVQRPDDGYVVKFNDWDPVDGYKKKFWVKFTCEDDKWKTGVYNMPSCFNKKKLEAANTTKSLRIGQFLIDCKTLVECFTYRKQQFKQLEDFLEASDLYCAIPHADPSYKIFSITLERIVENRFEDPYLIVVKLGYSENTTKPTNLIIESASDLELDESDQEILQNHFKVLKQLEMVAALEEIFNSPETKEIWKRKSPMLEERLPSNKQNSSRLRRNNESFESDDSTQGSKRRIGETLTPASMKRSRLTDNFSNSSDSETQDENVTTSKKKRGKLKTVKKATTSGLKNNQKPSKKKSQPQKQNSPVRQKPSPIANFSRKENTFSKNKKPKPSGVKKISRPKLPSKKKKT